MATPPKPPLDDIAQALGARGPAVAGGPAASRIYADLRQRIIDLELKPDTTIARQELARGYGASQTPVREALQLLEQDGLVRVHPQSRTVVARISAHQLHETHFLRVALETEVVRQLAGARDTAASDRARSLVRMQQTLLGDPAQMGLFLDLDRAFHAGLFEAVGMQGLHALMLRRQGHLARCQRLELPRTGKMVEIVSAHAAIVEAIAAGDPDAAARAMRAHVTGTINRVAALQAEFPDYFEPAPA